MKFDDLAKLLEDRVYCRISMAGVFALGKVTTVTAYHIGRSIGRFQHINTLMYKNTIDSMNFFDHL